MPYFDIGILAFASQKRRVPDGGYRCPIDRIRDHDIYILITVLLRNAVKICCLESFDLSP